MANEMNLHQADQSWGDKVMPLAGAERQAKRQRLQGHGDPPESKPEHQQTMSSDAEPLLYVGGRPVTPDEGTAPPLTSPLPQTDAVEGNWAPLEGPGNEAMQGGVSPSPRGYTGGAMGRTVAGLSPSFQDAASGAPPDLDAAAHPGAEHTPGEENLNMPELPGEKSR